MTASTPAATSARHCADSGHARATSRGWSAPYPFDGYGSVMVDDPELDYALETQAMSTFQQD